MASASASKIGLRSSKALVRSSAKKNLPAASTQLSEVKVYILLVLFVVLWQYVLTFLLAMP